MHPKGGGKFTCQEALLNLECLEAFKVSDVMRNAPRDEVSSKEEIRQLVGEIGYSMRHLPPKSVVPNTKIL